MKICHVTTAHDRYDDRIFQKECISLTKEYEVHLVVNDTLKDEIREGVYIHSMNTSFRNRVERICSIKKVLKYLLTINAEVYHLHDPELLLIATQLIKQNKKVIFDSHEYYYEQIKTKKYIPVIFRNIIAALYKQYETYVCKRINGVISICPLRREDGSIYNPFQGRCKLHQYIANYPIYRESEDCIRDGNEVFKICYAGGLTHERGITYLIDACYAANCKLVLAGTFSSTEYQQELEKKESYQCVDYRGQCTPEEVFDIYKEASVGASTLLDSGQYFKIETFPVKVYEYFQMNLPVLISAYPYAIEMNEQYKFGITVTPDDIGDMSRAITTLKNNKTLCSNLGNEGYNLYSRKLNWNIEEKKIYELYLAIRNEK